MPGGTDCYYCINHMTCLIHVYYCLVVLVTTPDHLFAIMLHVYVVPLSGTCYTFCGGILLTTLPDACYTSCGDILFMYTYTLHCMPLVPVYTIDIISVYSHCYRMAAYFIYMFTCITSTILIVYKPETIIDMTR